MKLRSFIVTLVTLALLGAGFVYRQTATAAPPQAVTASTATTAFAEDIEVTIRVTGIAHLIGDYGAPTRDLMIPNHKNSDHELLIMVDSDYTSELLDEKRTVDFGAGMFGRTYKYDEFPDGYEVDLAASGWVPPMTPKLTLSEAGDETNPPATCPTGTVAKTSLHWLPRMSRVNKASVTVKDSYQKKDPKPRHVLARMEIIDGELSAALQPSARKFEFDTNGVTGTNDGDFVQAVADYLDYKFKARVATGQPFVLKGRKFRDKRKDPDQWREIVRVIPKNKKVVILLANVIEDGFFEPRQITQIEHFHHYYDAFNKPAKNIRQVVAGDECADGTDSGVECGPVRP